MQDNNSDTRRSHKTIVAIRQTIEGGETIVGTNNNRCPTIGWVSTESDKDQTEGGGTR